MRRYLIGPQSREWLLNHLPIASTRQQCLTFGEDSKSDILFAQEDSLSTFLNRLPVGWKPDFIVLWLGYSTIPMAVFELDIPIIGAAPDWNWQWHSYRRIARFCDLILTDSRGVERFHAEGILQTRAAMLFGPNQDWTNYRWNNEQPRDIDLLFVGNLHPDVQADRLPWLSRIAQISDRYKVVIASGVFGDEYRKLLNRSRLLFNRAVRGECNMRVFEAAFSGAVLLQEHNNSELPLFLSAGQEYVEYDERNLEEQIASCLADEPKRIRMAQAARQRLAGSSFESYWNQILDQIPELNSLALHSKRISISLAEQIRIRSAQLLGAQFPRTEYSLPGKILAGIQENRLTRDFAWEWAAVSQRIAAVESLIAAPFGEIEKALLDALDFDSQRIGVFAALANHYQNSDRRTEAAQFSQMGLQALTQQLPFSQILDDPLWGATGFDELRVRWEKAAWENAGDPIKESEAKQRLLRWKFHSILARCEGQLANYYEAFAACSDSARTAAALGCALALSGKLSEAISYLRQAVTLNPFDAIAARAFYQALGDCSQYIEQAQFAKSQAALSVTTGGLVPSETWHHAYSSHRPVLEKNHYLIGWEGEFTPTHSLALVNRTLTEGLLQQGHLLSIIPTEESAEFREGVLSKELNDCRQKRRESQDVWISQHWPPLWNFPEKGHWVLFQPWEFGSIPQAWLPQLEKVDEVWVNSRTTRDAYVSSGVPADRVRCFPLGVDLQKFRPEVAPYPLKTRKRWKFLYVGGVMHRKGTDLLLRAFCETFKRFDDVCLVIKDMGVSSFYRQQPIRDQLRKILQNPELPEIEYLDQELSDAQIAGLYTACDCLVIPFRGEGFCLPIIEAMASGLPVLVTGASPALDYCDSSVAYLIPAIRRIIPKEQFGELRTVNDPFLVEPDLANLKRLLAYIAKNPQQAQAKGRLARERVLNSLTWDHSVRYVENGLQELLRRPIRRQTIETIIIAATPTNRTVRVSLTMMVKNEEANLEDCLLSVRDLVDEMIVVDTGSQDRTREIAQRLGAKVYDFPWVDSFAAARNEGLKHATGDWVFWMDADDRVDEANRQMLKELFDSLDSTMAAYVLKCLCVSDGPGGAETVVDHVRLFRRDPRLLWRFRVHEQILPDLRSLNAEIRWSDATIRHVGYKDPALRKSKLGRDRRLLELEIAENPSNPFTLFNLGSIHQELGEHQIALDLFRRSLAGSHPSDSIVRKLYALIVQAHRKLGQNDEAFYAVKAGLQVYPQDSELIFLHAMMLRERGDIRGAEACFKDLINTRESNHFASVDTGLRGYKARHNLAILYMEQGRFGDAQEQWQQVLESEPTFLPALAGFAEIAARLNNKAIFESYLQRMSQLGPTGEIEAESLWVRYYMNLNEFSRVRDRLFKLIEKYPQSVLLRTHLTHALLREGKDPQVAQKALLDLLELDPNNAEAKHNLLVLETVGFKSA